jgi:protease PrsW
VHLFTLLNWGLLALDALLGLLLLHRRWRRATAPVPLVIAGRGRA